MHLPFGYSLDADFHGAFLAFLGIFLVFAILILFTNRRRVVRSGSVALLDYTLIVGGRLIASLLILLLIFNPEIQLERTQLLPKRVVLLVDQSMSMQRAWTGDELEVSEQIKDFITRAEALYPLDLLSMDGGVMNSDEIRLDGTISSFDWQPSDIHEVQAVLLLTDGHLNRGRSPVDMGWTSRLPIFPVHPLDPRTHRSLQIEQMDYREAKRVGEPIEVILRLHQQGLIGQVARIAIRDESEEILSRQTVRLDQMFSQVTLDVPLSYEGSQTIRVTAALDDGSLLSEKRLLVEYGDQRKAVLLLSETLDLMHKFVLLSLPDSLYSVSTTIAEGTTEGTGTNEADSYDLIILNNPGRSSFGKLGTTIEKAVIHEDTPLIIFYPGREPLSAEWADLLGLRQSRVKWEGELPVSWDHASEAHPLFLGLLGAGFSAEQLHELPPILHHEHMISRAGAASLISTRPGMLSESVIQVASEPPLLIFNGENFWKWLFYSDVKSSFTIFWDYLLNYLDSIEDFQAVQLSMGQDQGETGDHFPLEVRVRDVDGAPVISEVNVWQEGRSEQRTPLDVERAAQGVYRSEISTKIPGDYQIIAEAYRFGELWGRDTSTITLTTFNEEGQSEGVDKVFLQRLAEHSNGGRIIRATDNPPIFPDQKFEKVTTYQLKGLRSAQLFFVLLIVLMLEWIIRRRNGLL